MSPSDRSEVRRILLINFDRLAAAWALPDHLEIQLATGRQMEVPWQICTEKLAQASAGDRAIFRLSPSGYGNHSHLLDEDLAVGPLCAVAAAL